MRLARGGSLVLEEVCGPGTSNSVILGLSWDSGSMECDACALVCGADGQVLERKYLLFWDNLMTPERAVFLRHQMDPHGSKDRAQVLVDLTGLPSKVETIVLTLSTFLEGRSLRSVDGLRLRVVDPGTGKELVHCTPDEQLAGETCAVIAELDRHRGAWKLRATIREHPGGMVDFCRAHGVDLQV